MSGNQVLLVEDEPTSADALAILLRMHGFEVRVAGDAREAMALIEESRPNLVLSDIMMPGMSGIELMDTLRGDPHYQDLPVVLMSSAYGALNEARERASAVLTKPLDFRRLVPLLWAMLREPEGNGAPRA